MAYQNVSNDSKCFPKGELPKTVVKGTPAGKGSTSRPDKWEGASLPKTVGGHAPTGWQKG